MLPIFEFFWPIKRISKDARKISDVVVGDAMVMLIMMVAGCTGCCFVVNLMTVDDEVDVAVDAWWRSCYVVC